MIVWSKTSADTAQPPSHAIAIPGAARRAGGDAGCLADARRGLCRVHRQRRDHALLCSFSGRVHRGVPLVACRDLDCLFGLAARRRRQFAVCRRDGRSSWPAASADTRRQPTRSGALGERVHYRNLANRSVVRDRHDDRRELPRFGGFRAIAVTAVCAASRHGDIDCSIRQRLCTRGIGAARPVSDLHPRLARNLFCAGRVHCRCSTAACSSVSPRRPLSDCP